MIWGPAAISKRWVGCGNFFLDGKTEKNSRQRAPQMFRTLTLGRSVVAPSVTTRPLGSLMRIGSSLTKRWGVGPGEGDGVPDQPQGGMADQPMRFAETNETVERYDHPIHLQRAANRRPWERPPPAHPTIQSARAQPHHPYEFSNESLGIARVQRPVIRSPGIRHLTVGCAGPVGARHSSGAADPRYYVLRRRRILRSARDHVRDLGA